MTPALNEIRNRLAEQHFAGLPEASLQMLCYKLGFAEALEYLASIASEFDERAANEEYAKAKHFGFNEGARWQHRELMKKLGLKNE